MEHRHRMFGSIAMMAMLGMFAPGGEELRMPYKRPSKPPGTAAKLRKQRKLERQRKVSNRQALKRAA